MISSLFLEFTPVTDLGIADMTVKMHRRHVMLKMQAARLAQLVRLADELGVSGPEPAN